MGQRHQIFLFTKDENGNTVGTGIHHQWLFGFTAVMKAEVVMAYAKKALKDKYHPFVYPNYFHKAKDCLLALYQINLETGFFNTSASHLNYLPTDTTETEAVKNPRVMDNNDGITVFDFRNPKQPMYCMVNISTYDTEYAGVHNLPSWVPCTTGEYLRAYYPQAEYDKLNEKDKKQFDKAQAKSEKLYVMGQAELAELFPAVFVGQEKARRVKAGM